MIYKFAIIAAIIFMFIVLSLVRHKKLHEKYSILWIAFAIMIIIISLGYEIVDRLSLSIGIYYSPTLLFLAGFIFLVLYIIHISTVITKQSKDLVRLNQELSILKEKIESENKK